MPQVVTCILENKGEILILKRSEQVRTYRGLWGGVAGYVEQDEDPFETALKEIQEEAGLNHKDVKLVKRGDPIRFTDVYNGQEYDWVVYPFVFTVEDRDLIRIDWEHSEYQWINPLDIEKYETVPHLKDIVKKMCV